MSEKTSLTNHEFNKLTLKNGEILQRFTSVVQSIQNSDERPTDAQLQTIGLTLSRYKDVATPQIEQVMNLATGANIDIFTFNIEQWKTLELSEIKFRLSTIESTLIKVQTLL